MSETTKAPCVSLEFEAMTDMQLLRELGRLHFELFDRLYVCWLDGANPDNDSGRKPDPSRIEQGLLLGSRLEAMAAQFREGPMQGPGEITLIGIDEVYDSIRKAATKFEGEAVAS